MALRATPGQGVACAKGAWMYVCLCRGVKESEVRDAAARGVVTMEQLVETFGWDGDEVCGRCLRNILRLAELAAEGKENVRLSSRAGIARRETP